MEEVQRFHQKDLRKGRRKAKERRQNGKVIDNGKEDGIWRELEDGFSSL